MFIQTGKTVMALATILKKKQIADEGAEEEEKNWFTNRDLLPSQATLVVCPKICMTQWENEIISKVRGARVYFYHGRKRTDSSAILAQHDIVITGYPTISEFSLIT
jgi:SNF2 family DNA or RNA helicase